MKKLPINTGIWQEMEELANLKNSLGSARRTSQIYARQVNKTPRWLMKLLQVYEKFGSLLGKAEYKALTFAHYSQVVSLEKKQARRLLDEAVTNNWSAHRLRQVLQTRNPLLKRCRIEFFEGCLRKENEVLLLRNSGAKMAWRDIGVKFIGSKVRIMRIKE